jgi:hypothetical protein
VDVGPRPLDDPALYGWLVIVFAAMMVETLMSLASPWPLKIVLDNALGHDKLPEWLAWVHDLGIDRDTMGLALFAGLATIVIAILDSVASYIDNYYNRKRRPVGSRTICAFASTTICTGCRSAITQRTRPARCCRR